MAERDARVELNLLWTKTYPSVFSFIRSSVRDFHRSEDVMQEVAEAVAKSFENYDRDKPFQAWVFGIARNKVLMHLRSKSTDRHVFDEATVETLATAFVKTSDSTLSSRREALAECLARVDGRSRRFLDMRYAQGESVASIAKSVDVTANAVSLVLHRIRVALRQCIEQRLSERATPRTAQ